MSPDRNLAYQSLALRNAFEFAIGLAAVWTGVGYFLVPHLLAHAAIGRVLNSPLDTVWNVVYLAGGLLIVGGLLRHAPRLEMPGLILLCGGALTQGFALIQVYGLLGAVGVPTLIFVAWAAVVEAMAIWKTQKR